jgi:hypothetical protein
VMSPDGQLIPGIPISGQPERLPQMPAPNVAPATPFKPVDGEETEAGEGQDQRAVGETY